MADKKEDPLKATAWLHEALAKGPPIMAPCGLGQQAKPLPDLDPETEDLKVRSLINLGVYIRLLAAATAFERDMKFYVPGLLTAGERAIVSESSRKISVLERELVHLLDKAQRRLAKGET